MKLAEALLLRADQQRVFAQLLARAEGAARFQEGDTPPEDANALVAQALEVLTRLETLIRRINETNSVTALADGRTLTAALAERDVLGLRHSLLSGVAEAASASGGWRQLRSELRTISAVPVAELRDQANDVARRRRQLDGQIQQLNWATDLVGGDDDLNI